MDKNIHDFIIAALKEDVGAGDYTSLACIPADVNSSAKLLVKQNGVLSGVNIALAVFNLVDTNLKIKTNISDGALINKGDIVLEVTGNAQSILKAERLVLNFMQRMSGVATLTNQMQNLIKHTNCKLLDTRKTTPGFRLFEKMAVLHGGGHNHRFGLYDMIMIKDNHIDYAGGISKAITATHAYLKANNLDLKIEIETRNLDEVRQVLNSEPVTRIMLDNFNPTMLAEAINIIDNKTETEASGGIDKNTIVSYAETGVNFISVGALTHSYTSLDLSLKAI